MLLPRPQRIYVAALGVILALGQNAGRAEPTEFPSEARDQFEEGQDLQKKGKLQDAIKAYDEAIRLGMKDYPRVHLYRANSYLDLKKYDTAVAKYTQFLKDFSLEDSCRY
jgi:tetratricopeptide (TPR) repeat protein